MRNPPSSDAIAGTTGGAKVTPCCSKLGLKRGPWTPEEDELLANFIRTEGEGRWRTLPKRAGLLRCGKSCRLRWMNYLRPSVKRGHIAPDEEDLILRLHRLLGNRWSLIAGRIPGRTDNEIKNYWNTHLSKKLISQGIDPRTHKPLINNDIVRVDKGTRKKNGNNKGVSLSESVPPNPNPLDNIHTLPSYLSDESNSGAGVGVGVGVAATQTAPHFDFSFDPIRNNHPYPNVNANGFISNVNFGTSTFPSNNNNSGSNGCGESPGSLEDRESDPNYCSEDVFSSFLNSLINEDLYTNQTQHEGLLAQPTSSTALAFGAVEWDAPLMSASTAAAAAAAAFQHNPSEDQPQ